MIIYGRNPVLEALRHGHTIDNVIIRAGTNRDIVASCEHHHVPVEIEQPQAFDARQREDAQGVIAYVTAYGTQTLDDVLEATSLGDNPVFLMLDGITDPHNFGAILRTAEAAGVRAVIIKKHGSVKITPTVVKVSAGAVEHIDVVIVTNLRNTIDTLKERGFWAVGTSLDAEKAHTDIFVDRPLLVVIGSEGKGMSRLVGKTVDYSVKIPMRGSINSLNASVSAGIVLFEIMRKKG